VNDIADRESDRQHPLKSRRPIASGALPVQVALGAIIVLGIVSLAGAAALGRAFTAVAATYLSLQILYSLLLKHIVIVDVLTIAVGFVLRAVGGAVAVDVEISHWLLVCTILLALFIAMAKRRHEIVLLADGASDHRPILGEYSAYLLDQMIGVVTASTLISYVFYTISPETEAKFGTDWLGFTIPFPLYGIFRYLYLVHRREGGGSPSDLLLTDRPLLACVALWAVTVALIIYRPF
jgi:4-hydroxybenzoate polyprenyltransferase